MNTLNVLSGFMEFLINRKTQILDLLIQHVELTVCSIVLSILIGIPLAILITRINKLASPVIGLANIAQSIPSIAFLGFLIPIMGIGSKPAITAVVVYSLLPIVKSTFTGLNNINESIIEAAEGIGLTPSDILFKIKLPLAMPVIMSGIRIAAVTAVGLMTIAAFIGAGGLGYLVFSGVQSVDNYMILSGAIPACILAIALDYIIGKVEKVMVPKCKENPHNKISLKNKRVLKLKKYKPAIAILAIMLIGSTMFTAFNRRKNTITIGSINFNEQLILGNMISSLIENNTKYKVDRKLNLGGTSVVFNALKSGNIDLYVEYTGAAFVDVMKRKPISDPQKVYSEVKDYYHKNYQLEWLNPLGFNNTYVLAVDHNLADKYNLNNISDLAKVSNTLNLGCTIEFANRLDGYIGLQKLYGLNFKNVKGIDGGLRYTSLESNETQVADAFSTDGLLKKFDLKLLKDDKGFFPPYYAVPLVREDTLSKYPEIKPLILKLSGQINEETMRELNYRVDKGEDPKKVAEDFLKSKGLIN